ncbi:MAG: hypothetical protein M3066_16415 [Actinomycetota bacterium]|nr:hypothetical protein [Actinomycetota bacterium]
MAYGLPVEGDDGPFLGSRVAAAATCDVTLTVGDARAVMDGSGADVVVLVHAGGLAVGEVDRDTLDGHEAGIALLEVFQPVPSTVRPSVTVASVAEADGGDRLVTTSDGRLLGRASIDATDERDHDEHDHEGHDHEDHEGHEHGGDAIDMEAYEQELTEVMKAIEERFGDREPPAEELRAFLHARLLAEGRSAEDADRFLDELEAGEAD